MVEPVSRSLASAQFTMTGTVYVQGAISVGFAAEEAIPVGEVTSPHWAFFHNKDATNFISLRPGSGAANAIRLKAGEYALVPLNPAVVWYAIADTAACKMEYLIFDV